MNYAVRFDPVNYKNGPKNNWRRTAWNAIHEFTPNPRDALVLYLPGESNLDRDVALRHGFLEGNLVAIERRAKVASSVRDRFKQTVIQAELYDVLHSWPEQHRVGVLFADLVSGFDTDAWRTLAVWISSNAFKHSTLALNVMRGRESSSVAKVFLREPCLKLMARFDLAPKHRASAVMQALYALTVICYFNAQPDAVEPMHRYYAWKFLQGYKSESGQVFDTTVIKCKGLLPRGSHASEADVELLKSIRAAMAVRTMRLRGDFAC